MGEQDNDTSAKRVEDSKKRVVVMHNVPSPYRLPLFEALSEKYDLTVYFLRGNKDHRNWDTDPDEFDFEHEFLPGVSLGPIVVNYTLLFELLRNEFDTYVVGDTKAGVVTSLLTFLYTRTLGGNLIFWSGWISTSYSGEVRKNGLLRRTATRVYRAGMEVFHQFTYPRVDGFISYSELTTQFLIEHGADPETIVEGGQVMPSENLPAPPNETDGDSQTVLFVGYLQERKGVQDLLEAWNRTETRNWTLKIAGSGPYESTLKRKVEEIDTDSIKFVGYVDGKEKAQLYQEAKVFVLPTLHDPWGLVVNEALYYGTPVVTTSAAGAADLVKAGDFGIVVEPDDTDALSEALSKLLTDASLRSHYRRQIVDNRNIGVDRTSGVKTFQLAIEERINNP